ncbi:NAD(P)-dependent oxidoreductase [Leptospira sp. 201903071]|uniref:NAD-dependent epimerase/dehydratase family protein n=1 Tax=Leptospira ainazelensis TaxID=2810034 RepID=UPI0019637F8B|nr:NAD(P)-dependent oxidoreductase [Leptospira ainazelensis]MBM9499545.1 NAD(P)-dependent oxidoreductase [Leptospira ainazelensis]
MKEREDTIRTILLTGGSGSLGLTLLPKLLKNYRVVCIGRNLSSFPDSIRFEPNFVFYEFDLEGPKELLINEEPSFIIHLAGKVSGEGSTYEDYKRGNETATQKILNFASKHKKTGILFSSSTSVYGFSERPVTEVSALKGKTFYALSKIECETLIQRSKNKFVILRIASVYGPTNKSFLNKLFRIFQYGLLLCSGNPEFKKSMVYSSDVIDAILLVLEKWKKVSGKIYNVAHPKPFSFQDFEYLIRDVFPGKFYVRIRLKGIVLLFFNILNTLYSKLTNRKINVDYIQETTIVDSSRIQKDIGFEFKVSFEEGIREIARSKSKV